MTSGKPIDSRVLGRAYGLFTGAFAVLLGVLAILARLGLGMALIGFLVVAASLLTYAAIGVVSRSLSIGEFTTAARRVPAGLNGMATFAAFLSIGGFVGLVGAFFADAATALAMVAGWTLGFLLLTVLIAPYFRKTGAVTLPDCLAIRFGSPLVRAAGAIILVISSFAILPAALAAAATIIGQFLKFGPELGLATAVAVVLISCLFGGMRAVSFVAGAQAIIIVLAVLLPATILSLRDYGFPLPQLTYGYALEEVDILSDQGIGVLSGQLLPVNGLDWAYLIAVTISLAAGIASLPHILARSATCDSIGAARRSIGFALVLVAAVATTAPAIAAFAKQAIVNTIAGVDLDTLPDWLFTYGRDGLITACGANAGSPAAIGTACGASKVINGLAAGDIAVNTDTVALAFAEMTGLADVLTALIAAGALAAALATATAVLMAITVSLGHDAYSQLAPRAPAGRRLILNRLILIAVLAGATWLATHRSDLLALALLAPSLAASGFLPALVLGFWWRRTTWIGALAGMIVGFAAAAAYALFNWDSFTGSGFAVASSAILGLPVGFAVTAVVSLLTPAPTEERLAVFAAIRRPGRDPIREDFAI